MLWLARQESLVRGFVAYDCANATNSVNAYSLLESAACPTIETITRWKGPSLERSSK
jgi:hypothetical protein